MEIEDVKFASPLSYDIWNPQIWKHSKKYQMLELFLVLPFSILNRKITADSGKTISEYIENGAIKKYVRQ